MKKQRSSGFKFIPAFLWMGVLFFFSHQSRLDTGLSWDFWFKKGAHLFSYGLLAVLLARALGSRGWTWVSRHAEKAWSWAVLYGVFDEIHQAFVPLRNPSPRDVCIDALGAFIGLTVFHAFKSSPSVISNGPRLRDPHPVSRARKVSKPKPVARASNAKKRPTKRTKRK